LPRGRRFSRSLPRRDRLNLQIRIPSQNVARRIDPEFETQGRVVHVTEPLTNGERVVGVQFTGPRFQRVFRPESAI